MDYLQIMFFAVVAVGAVAIAYILIAKPTNGSAMIAASLAGLFGGYTAIQIYQEGVIMFFTNHSVNMTGIQVWWDLVMCVIIGLFLIAPRARKQNMNVPLWALFVGTTASIGLLAMCARLFWLEQVNAQETPDAKPAGEPAPA